MSGFWTVYRRELAALFLMPLAWMLLCVALPLIGALFVLSVEDLGGDLNAVFRFMLTDSVVPWVFLVFLPPLLTMRMISEEARTGVLEYLLTAPVTDAAVVTAKLLAATTFMALFWSAFLVYGLACQLAGTPPEWSTLLVQVLGCWVLSALFCSVGIFASALTQTPLVAAVCAVMVGLALIALPSFGALLRLPANHWGQAALGQLSIIERWYGSFGAGVIDSAHLVFFVGLTGLFGFFAVRLVESRRWR